MGAVGAAGLARLDDAHVEANNGAIRRRVKRHVQCNGPSMVDVAAEFVQKWSREARSSICGTPQSDTEEGTQFIYRHSDTE